MNNSPNNDVWLPPRPPLVGWGDLPKVYGPLASYGAPPMAKTYAGVLGSLGVAVAMLRGALAGAGFEGTVMTSVNAMIAMAAVGFVVGAIAETTVDTSVRTRLESQLAEVAGADAAASGPTT